MPEPPCTVPCTDRRGGAGTCTPAAGRHTSGLHDIDVRDASDGGAGLQEVFSAACGNLHWQPRVIQVALLELQDWMAWLDEACALLDPAELARVRRRRFASDRDALALGYALHRLLLGEVLGCDSRDVPLYRDPRGCPRLASGIAATSLSHAGGVVALAVAAPGPLGVDIEPTASAAAMPPIAARVCHPGEAVALGMLAAPLRSRELLRLWVRKEAVLKAAGVGLAVAMESFSASEDHPIALAGIAGAAIHVRMLDGGPRHVAAIAARAPLTVDCRWLVPAAQPGARRADCNNALN